MQQICIGQNNDLNTFHVVIPSFLVINLSETLSNDQKTLVLHNVISYNYVTFGATWLQSPSAVILEPKKNKV